jgi:signal transduction histidine kinase
MTIGIFLVYFFGANLLQNIIVGNYAERVRFLGNDVSELLDREVEFLKVHAAGPEWNRPLLEHNVRYSSLTEEEARLLLLKENEIWIEPVKGGPARKECLENALSNTLRRLVKDNKDLAGIYVFDRLGGLVAASDESTGFYQQEVIAQQDGKVTVGDITFKPSINDWVMPVTLPLRDQAGKIIGICRADISTRRSFAKLEDFRDSALSNALLADESGVIVSSSEFKPLSKKFTSDADLQRLLTSKKKYEIVDNPPPRRGKTFVVFADIKLPSLSGDTVVRRIFMDRDAEEVFASLNRLITYLVIVSLIVIVIMVPVGYFFGGLFIKPIKKLQESVQQVIKGNFDFPIAIHTRDEIEQFADSFREMILNIKNKQKDLLGAKNQLEILAKSLEEKVTERTSELKEANDKLAAALNIKSRFTSMVSHELRTPLTAIKEGISVASSEISGALNEIQKKCLTIAARNVERLNRLINEILDFQKLESGKMTFDIQENNMNEVVKEVRESMLLLAESRKIDITLELDENLPLAKFDKDKITQVLINLINNAIKFTEEGNILIKTSHGENHIQVTVQDTGIGIKEEDMPKLFQAFTQIESDQAKKADGTGLGLVISLEIIKAHGGKIWPESTFGQGTTIHFVLPIRERRKPA